MKPSQNHSHNTSATYWERTGEKKKKKKKKSILGTANIQQKNIK
jgi:hypothetical protein